MATGTFTEEEQGRYDRQIRLWGIEAQQRSVPFMFQTLGPFSVA